MGTPAGMQEKTFVWLPEYSVIRPNLKLSSSVNHGIWPCVHLLKTHKVSVPVEHLLCDHDDGGGGFWYEHSIFAYKCAFHLNTSWWCTYVFCTCICILSLQQHFTTDNITLFTITLKPTCERWMCRVSAGTRDAADSLSSTALPSGASSVRGRIRHACWTLKCCLPCDISPSSQSSDCTSPNLPKPALPAGLRPSNVTVGRRRCACRVLSACASETRACLSERVAPLADCQGPTVLPPCVLFLLQRLFSGRLI